MISSMRTRFRSKKYQSILWISMFSLVFAASLPELFKRIFGSNDWVLKVEGVTVSPELFQEKMEKERQRIEYIRQQLGPYANLLLASAGDLDPKTLATKELTNEILLNKSMKKLNVHFDTESVKLEILKKMPKQIIDQYGTDLNILGQLLGYPNTQAFINESEKELKNLLGSELIAGALYIPEFELINLYNVLHSKKKYSVLIFTLEKYLNEAKKTALNKEDVKKYFEEQNKKEKRYWLPEKREGIKWSFNAAKYAQITDKDIENYYNRKKAIQFLESPAKIQVKRILLTGKDNDLSEATKEAKRIHSELVQDKNKFGQYAKQYSQDKDTAAKDGLVGFFSKGQKDKAFEAASFALKNPGDISDVFETKYGVEIVQLVEKIPSTFKPLKDVKDSIKADVEKDKFERSFLQEMKRFSFGAKDNKFEEFAKKREAKSSKIDLMSNDNSPIAQKLFEIKKENGLSSYIDKNKGIAIQLTKIEKSHLPEFESVYKQVENDLYEQKALRKLEADLKKAKEKSATTNFEQLKEQFGATLKVIPWLSIDQKSEIEKLQKENIPVDKLLEIEQEKMITDAVSKKAGYLMKLDEIEPFDSEGFERKKSSLEADFARRRKQELETGFIDSLRKNAKIDTNEEALKQFRSIR